MQAISDTKAPKTMTTLIDKKSGSTNATGKYLTFKLGIESYGIDVLKVREIIRHLDVTTVPQMPDYIRGVINLRGKIVPVMDLRRRFEFSQVTDTDQTCIIVVQLALPGCPATAMGMVVDGVEEVVNLNTGDIEATPNFGGQIATDYILGMAKVKGAVKVLLDIDRVVRADSLAQLQLSAF